ncbi:MAG: hypothetical protein H7249_02050 [Chitinophagaceae bacterium]|nr:hypothetical protein [Oligoflexus sp.]
MFAIFPELLHQAEKGDLEAVACLVRKYFADGQVFVPNLRVAELCANAEIKIDQNIKTGAARLEAWDANGQFRIVISIHPEIRGIREQNYILAQMLGHVFLDLQPKMAKGELQRSIFEKKTSPLRALLLNPETLTPVDDFALSLLLPKAMVKKAMGTLSSRTDAAAFFNVELPLFECRLLLIDYYEKASGAAKSAFQSKPNPSTQARAEPGKTRSEQPRSVEPKSAARASASASSSSAPLSAEGKSRTDAAKPSPKTLAPSAEQTRAAKPQAPKKDDKAVANADLSSLARVNRSVAARTYKKEGERADVAATPQPSPGMERLRQLARKIDKSVDE